MMKRFYLIVISLVMAGVINAANDGYRIKVKIANLKDTSCYLANYYGNKQYIQDTARLDANGELVFEGKEKLPGGIYIFYCPAVKTNSKIFDIIITDKQNFSIETDTVDFVKNMKIKGNDETQYWNEYLMFIREKQKLGKSLTDIYKKLPKDSDSSKMYREKLKVLDEEVVAYKVNFMKKHPESFVSTIFKMMKEIEVPEDLKKASSDSLFEFKYYKSHYFDNVNFSDDRILRTPLFQEKIDFYMNKLTGQHPDSIITACDYLINKARPNKEMFKYMVWYFTYTYETSPIMGYDKIFVHLGNTYYKTGQAVWLDTAKLNKVVERVNVLEPLLLGKKAPDMVLRDSLEKPMTMYSVYKDYLVLVFWDSDCGHCKKEVPKIKELYDKYKAKGVSLEVLAICTEPEIPKWKKTLKEMNLNWLNVQDIWGERRKYDINSTPVIYLLDKDKKIIAKKLSAEQLDELINNLLKEKEKEKEK